MLNELSREVRSVALAICDGLAGSRKDEIKRLIRDSDWDSLCALQVNPKHYDNSESYFADAASVSFLKKYEALPTSIDRKAVAVKAFFEAELKCYRANQRLTPFLVGTYDPRDEAVLGFINQCREEVVNLIGIRPPSNPEGRFGPGSTFGDRGNLTTIPDKMQSVPMMTHDAWAFSVPFSGTLWGRACAQRDESIAFVQGNRFTTVPKDATKDRGIAVEPSINVFYQLAYGTAMRDALRKSTNHRLDLDHAADIHRQVARESSISGRFATLDLRQASDTVSKSLVELLLPASWLAPLVDLRSPKTSIRDVDGVEKVIVLEKFSSMGNGYTFELETTLFLAICCAVMRRGGVIPCPGQNVFVFGDDIIVPTKFAPDVIAALRYFGLSLNEEKSFIDGPFRESCGGDYFKGVDVRPYFLKEEPNEPQHFIAMANGIRRMGHHDRLPNSRWPYLVRPWLRVLDSLPVHVRHCRGPEELGDLVITDTSEFWETRTRSCRRYVRVYRPAVYRKVRFSVFDPDVQLAVAAYRMLLDPQPREGQVFPAERNFVPRDGVTGYKLGWVQFS